MRAIVSFERGHDFSVDEAELLRRSHSRDRIGLPTLRLRIASMRNDGMRRAITLR
jgi:hypothetical protein